MSNNKVDGGQILGTMGMGSEGTILSLGGLLRTSLRMNL